MNSVLVILFCAFIGAAGFLIYTAATGEQYPGYSADGHVCPRYWKDPRTDICYAYVNNGWYGLTFASVDCDKAKVLLDKDSEIPCGE